MVARLGKKRYRWRNTETEGMAIDIHTRAVQLPQMDWPQNSAVPPLYQTAAYTYKSLEQVDRIFEGKDSGYTYTRAGNPTTGALADLIASLEEGEQGAIAASGMGAILAAILALEESPGPILLAREVYGGSLGLVRRVLQPLGYRLVWVDTHDPEACLGIMLENRGGVLLLESISNPLGRVCALDTLIESAHRSGIKVIVDNTFATPYHVRPLKLGADLVVHSVTKFIGGHSDLILGAIVGKADIMQSVDNLINVMGITPDPYAAWLAIRGARTLALRMERASDNAMTLATVLKDHPALAQVNYPGLTRHPDYNVAKRILNGGFGAILGLSLKGGRIAAQEVIRRLAIVPFVPSLGDVMTTISHPQVASHRELTQAEQEIVAIDSGVLRVSVGIENVRDLIEDFTKALSALVPE